MSNLVPVTMSYAELADVLTDMAERARSGDSYEGTISYMMPEDGGGPDAVEVTASYRVGNQMGQGGMRMIGEIPDDAKES